MSTLKVNAIEPYSGGTVTITGATVNSASYAETANTLTAGDKTINGQLTVNTGNLNSNGYTNLTGGATVKGGNLFVEAGILITGSNLLQKDGFPGQSAHIFQNENFFTEYYGTDMKWNATGGEAQLACGALNKASLTANAFTPDFSTDNLINIQSTLASGSLFDDWSGTWMQVEENGSPDIKRNLTVQGTNGTPGNTFEAKDGTGTSKLFVQNGALKTLTGIDVVVNGVLQVDDTITLPNLGAYQNDADAAAGGVPLKGLYHHNGDLKIRLV